MGGCDHDLETNSTAKRAWPYPPEARDIRWGQKYRKNKLKLSPNPATFYTATVTWKKGELVPVLGSEVLIKKPRRVVAKNDVYVTRKVIDQGLEVKRREKVASAGEEVDFMFYNSRGFCMVHTKAGAAWTPCELDETFVGVTAEEPFACEQVWWVKVSKGKVDTGWMPFDSEFMSREPPPPAAEAR
ncbi:MAG: hypothetical protein AAF500_20730 [Myxococcota bacterium]